MNYYEPNFTLRQKKTMFQMIKCIHINQTLHQQISL